LTQFFISSLVLVIAIFGGLINFQLIAMPMSEMVGGSSYIGPMKTSDIAALVIIMVVILIVLTMFIKHITEPLQHMIGLSEKISNGDLSQTIRVEADNELAQLGHVINEMSSNLQEIILLSQGLCDNGEKYIDKSLHQLNRTALGNNEIDALRDSIVSLKLELSTLREFVACFQFYSVDYKR
jgi:methyl-accepting chemotaxis protein